MSDKTILEEASYRQIRDCLSNVHPDSWSNLIMIQKLSQVFYFNKAETTKLVLKQHLAAFWDQKITNCTNSDCAKQRAKELLSSSPLIVDSRPASLVIMGNLIEQQEVYLKASLKLQAAKEVNQEQGEESIDPEKCVAVKQEAQEEEIVSQGDYKRRKTFDPNKVMSLCLEGKVKALVEHFCDNKHVLDLSKAKAIPSRCKHIVDSILKESELQLNPTLTVIEYNIISHISKCTNKFDLDATVGKIDIFSQTVLAFVKVAVMKLCLLYHTNVLEGKHDEDWYRVNVHSDFFGLIFNTNQIFKTKKLQIIQELKESGRIDVDENDTRLNFMFTNSICTKVSAEDETKANHLRESTLRHWANLLPYEGCVKHLCILSCHFNKLEFKIMGTKMINGIIIHVCLKEITIPPSDSNSGEIAECLTTVISVFRMVAREFEIIKLMLKTANEYSMASLNKPSISKIIYRDDSPPPEGSGNIDLNISPSSFGPNWKEGEKKAIMANVERQVSLLVEKVNRSYVSASWDDIFYGERPYIMVL